MEHCVIYLSSSKGLFSEADLARILQQSWQNNRNLGITGILMYCNGCIIQALEGEAKPVQSLYERIRADPRHTQIILLYNGSIDKRTFSTWSMGYKTLSANELSSLRTQLPFMADSPSTALPQSNVVLRIIQRFYLDNRHQ